MTFLSPSPAPDRQRHFAPLPALRPCGLDGVGEALRAIYDCRIALSGEPDDFARLLAKLD